MLNINPGTVLLGYLLHRIGVDVEFKISVFMGNDNPFSVLWTLTAARLLSRDDGSTLWKQEQLAGRQLSPAVVVGPYVAVADLEGWLHWLSTADGQIVSRVRAVDSKVSAPLVTNGSSVFVYGEDGELASVSAP